MTSIRILLAVLSFVLIANASDFCAVTVFVSDVSGVPLPAPTELIDPTGKVVAHTEADATGRAEFCDFDFGEHSIIVGGRYCNSVVIRGVRLRYPSPQIFKVALTPCTGEHSEGNACEAYFRVRSGRGEPVAGAAVQRAEGGRPSTTDRYGRAATLISLESLEAFTFSAPGYEPQTLHLSCNNNWRIETRVTLWRKTK